MIEVDKIHPINWDSWNLNSSMPYLELYGETQPFICTNLTETLPANAMNNDPIMIAGPPIHKYFWTIGIPKHLYDRMNSRHDIKAEVTVYFLLTADWRVEEIVATIKFVRPLPHQDGRKMMLFSLLIMVSR